MKKRMGFQKRWSLAVLCAWLISAVPASAATYDWAVDAAGNWNDTSATGWNTGYPNAIDDIANLTLEITAGRTITINVADAIVGTLNLNDTGTGTDSAWTIDTSDAALYKLIFDVSSGNAVLTSAGTTNIINAPIVLNDTLDATATNNLTLNGVVSGSGGFNKLGGALLTLGGTEANTYGGLTTISAGTLALAKTAGINAIAGDLTINGGTARLVNANQIADTATITVNGGTIAFGYSDGGNFAGSNSETVANLNMTAGSLSFSQLNAATLMVSTATSLSGGTISVSTGNSKTINFGALSLSGGVINHSQVNTTGTLTLNATSLSIANTASGAYTPMTLQARTSGTSSQIASFRLSGDLTFTGNGTNANPVTINSVAAAGSAPALLQLLAGSGVFNIGDGAADYDLVIKPRITGSVDLVKRGAGTLVLDGPNSYTGATKIVAGALVLGSNAVSTTTAGVSYSANVDSDVFTAASGSFTNGEKIIFTGGTVPAGSSPNTPYYVVNASGTSFQIATTPGGTPVDITNTGASSGKLVTQVGALGATNSAVDLGDSLLTAPTDTIALLSNGAYTNARDINVVDAGAGTTIGATNAAATTATYSGTITLNKDVILGSENAGATTNFTGLIDDGGGTSGVIKSGAGIVNLSRATGNTYDGGTTVSSGTLLVNNTSGSATGTGTVTVAAGASLGGSGIISGNVVISGNHSPGNSPGVQTLGADLTYNSGASVQFELAANTTTQGSPTAVFDQILVGGDLDFAGLTTLNLAFDVSGSSVDWSDSLWSSNQSWLFYDVAGSTSNFGNLSLASLDWLDAQGDSFNTVLSGSSFYLSQSGSDIYIHYTTVVPEPSTYALVGLGLAGLWLLRRKARPTA